AVRDQCFRRAGAARAQVCGSAVPHPDGPASPVAAERPTQPAAHHGDSDHSLPNRRRALRQRADSVRVTRGCTAQGARVTYSYTQQMFVEWLAQKTGQSVEAVSRRYEASMAVLAGGHDGKAYRAFCDTSYQ